MSVNYSRWIRSYVGHQRILQLRACGFIRDEAGRILLCRRADVMLWDLPGGTIELNETPAQGLIREVREETGLHIEPRHVIGVYAGHDFEWTYPNGDQAQIVSLFFSCAIVGGVLESRSKELVNVAFFAENALPALLPRAVRMVQDAFVGAEAAHFD